MRWRRSVRYTTLLPMMKTEKQTVRNEFPDRFFRINGNKLKVLALLLMIVDHTGAIFFPGQLPVTLFGHAYPLLRLIGRLSFPIYAFLLAQGAVHTSNWIRYSLRLLLLFVVSEVPYDLVLHGTAWYWDNQNIFLTLLLGLLVIRADVEFKKRFPEPNASMYGVFALAAGCFLAQELHADYGMTGVLMCYLLYLSGKNRILQAVSLVLVNVFCYGGIQSYAALAIVPISLYDGSRGKNSPVLKWAFYVLYPVHLLVFFLLKIYL